MPPPGALVSHEGVAQTAFRLTQPANQRDPSRPDRPGTVQRSRSAAMVCGPGVHEPSASASCGVARRAPDPACHDLQGRSGDRQGPEQVLRSAHLVDVLPGADPREYDDHGGSGSHSGCQRAHRVTDQPRHLFMGRFRGAGLLGHRAHGRERSVRRHGNDELPRLGTHGHVVERTRAVVRTFSG